MTDRLGIVVSGSLESGVEVKLDGAVEKSKTLEN